MDLENILYGIIAVLVGVIARILDKPRSLKEKKSRPLGLSEAHFKYGSWSVLLGGIMLILLGIFN